MRAGWLARAAGAAVLALAAFAHAGPPAGTVIPNRASGTGMVGFASQAAASNVVTVTVGSVPAGAFAAVLAPDTQRQTSPGAVVSVAHTLSNVGTSSDTYTLALAGTGGRWLFDSAELQADANGDGNGDGPLPAAITLAPGATFRFVAVYRIPVAAQHSTFADARISATSEGGAAIAPILDRLIVLAAIVPVDCGEVTKSMSRERGPSPAGPVTVTLVYRSCDKPRARIVIRDTLPAGMRYVPGSARWSEVPGLALTDAAGDEQGPGPTRIAWDFGASVAGTAIAAVAGVPARAGGAITFDVSIAPGLAPGSVVPNDAGYTFYDAGGEYAFERRTEIATYHVTGRAGVELVGQTLPTADPGATVDFVNVLTNRGEVADTFDISLAGSTFPPGTTFALLQSDAVTPLADTDGNGVPDTGRVSAGASYRIVVRARLPQGAVPGSYRITKTARSAANPSVSASDDDAVDTVARRCAAVLDPDNNAQVGFGQLVTYTHYLTNRGNCDEDLRATLEFLANSLPGWTVRVFVDNAVGGGGSIPGVVDPTDTPIVPGWTATLRPGESLRILVEVRAPAREPGAGAVAASNLTTVVIQSARGALVVRDTTRVEERTEPPRTLDEIRNYVDATYLSPTPWGVVGGDLWLRADAPSCNADPSAVETRLVVLTGPRGEREEIVARETGPDTGVFALPPLAVRAPPVVAGNGTVEGRANDVFDVEVVGCGRRIATAVTLMSASSVVFDSRSNEPVAGAVVTLVAATGGRCGTAVAVAGNPATTGADGRFAFPQLPAGDYCLVVAAPNGYRAPSQVQWPLLPAGRNLHVTGLSTGGSYGGAFAPGAGLVALDIPLDPVAQDGLFVQKEASRPVVEVGEFVDYTVRVRNGTGNALDRADVVLADDLPTGFAYVGGSARRDGRAIRDPSGGAGPRLVLPLGSLARGAQAVVTYRVRVGPGAIEGDGVNRVQASYRPAAATTLSNVATARVLVTGGVFDSRGFILGKVWLDCDASGVQERGEPGVPGVRVLLEDGTYAETDGAGKFSFYGISNRTHVLKLDRTTLPAGARPLASAARHLGDGSSRMVDLKAGEMHRGDFALGGCGEATLAEVKARARAGSAGTGDELATVVGAALATEARPAVDVKAQPASGLVQIASGAAPPAGAPSPVAGRPAAGQAQAAPAHLEPPPAVALEELVPALDPALGFVGLVDGATMSYAQTAVRVKGAAGAIFHLSVNGVEVPAARVGKRAVLAERGVQAWEYIGVELAPGENRLAVTQVDPFGNPRGAKEIRVIAPGRLARLALEIPAAGAVADGKSTARIVVRLTDERGTPITVRTPVTLESSAGTWRTADLDPSEPGLQLMVEGGEAVALLAAPAQPQAALVAATSGSVKAEARLDFLPELRPLVAAGLVEGLVSLRDVKRAAIRPAGAGDGFEQELRTLSREIGDRGEAGARAAFYLKGKIKGEYLLTAAYDSDKDTRERLFRDIQPDQFYPIYGDSAVRGFDAQSTSRLYVRLDKGRSYLLWGDFTTQSPSELRKLTQYSRSLTGARHRFEGERVSADVFASRDTSRQVVEELRANGTSGPFQLGNAGALANSEKVEIVTRDRNQPALVISAIAQSRFSDYEIEALAGRILFRAPVPSVDRDLNPVFVRVTYEVDQGGEAFWVAGVEGQVKAHERVQVGGVFVKDRNPLAPFTLAGANAVVRVGEGTQVVGEIARTTAGVDERRGDAVRVEVKHESQGFKAHAFVARSDPFFENPGSHLAQGRGEAGARAEYKASPETTIKLEALRTEDEKTDATRDGLAAAIQHQMKGRLTLELGVRHAAEKGPGSPVPAVPAPGGGATDPRKIPEEVTTVRARVTGSTPRIEGLTAYGEVEVDVRDASRRVIAAGAEYPLANKGRIYGRHEFVSSITGPYGLSQAERQNTTAIGVDTEYMRDGRLFSEYRIRDAISGGDAEAAMGLKNLWSIAPGVKLATTFERVQALSGKGENENTAATFALDYTRNPLWKANTRLEVRDGQGAESLLFTVGLAARLSRDWSALARNAYTETRTKGDSGGRRRVERLQAGLAWRDSETNRANALARIEHRIEQNRQDKAPELRLATTLASLHADWQLMRPFIVTTRYAAKWATDRSAGVAATYRAQAAGARATWEFAPRWDLSVAASALFGDRFATRREALGVELGYRLAPNLWLSAGFNFSGWRDADLAGAEYTAKGAFVRMRYKFDEALVEAVPGLGAAERAP